MVCSVAPAGLVARSAGTGEVVWRLAASARAGRNAGLAVDGSRAVSAGDRTLRAADLDTGTTAWTTTLRRGSRFGAPAVADGVVYAASYGTNPTTAPSPELLAYRASDGAALWRESSTDLHPVAAGGRVYSVESGGRVLARDGRTGRIVATSDPSSACEALISGAGRLVCTGSPLSASDTFPPVTLVDPATLAVVRTLPQPGDKPYGGVISDDGVLVLREVNAEDPSVGRWIGVDLRTGSALWTSDGTTDNDVALVGGRAVWLTAANGSTPGRLVSVDLRKGPNGTGADAPRLSPVYPEAAGGRSARLTAQGRHVVMAPRIRPALRSVVAP